MLSSESSGKFIDHCYSYELTLNKTGTAFSGGLFWIPFIENDSKSVLHYYSFFENLCSLRYVFLCQSLYSLCFTVISCDRLTQSECYSWWLALDRGGPLWSVHCATQLDTIQDMEHTGIGWENLLATCCALCLYGSVARKKAFAKIIISSIWRSMKQIRGRRCYGLNGT